MRRELLCYAKVDEEEIFDRIKKHIGICKECGGLFLKTSKKIRVFCSNNCGSRYGNRRMRKAKRLAK